MRLKQQLEAMAPSQKFMIMTFNDGVQVYGANGICQLANGNCRWIDSQNVAVRLGPATCHTPAQVRRRRRLGAARVAR